jgi:DNA-binding NtrC family response regulator
MQVVLAQVARAAESRAHVLVYGEAGTGRELIARETHRRGPSATAQFINVDCGGGRGEDLEFELFGGRTEPEWRDSAARATLERVSRGSSLHQAFGGTLFFEHITEMPSRIQARLARVLRDREVLLSGERTAVEVDVRAIAAVAGGYDEAAAEGRILGELHRLVSAMRIDVPSLRDRREDIPALAQHFVDEQCRRAAVPRKELNLPVRQLIAALPWHGNASELRTLVGAMIPRVAGQVVELHDLLAVIQLDGRAQTLVVGGSLREARSRFEREYVAAVLAQHRGRVPDAAKTLGIQRTNLYRKMRHLRLLRK